MEQKLKEKILHIEGMTCTGCEARIENVLRKSEGVIKARASYSNSSVYITYDEGIIKLTEIIEKIEKLDYEVAGVEAEKTVKENTDAAGAQDKLRINQILGIAIVLVALYMIIDRTIGFNFIPEIDQNMGYGMLFIIGLLTSIHCIAMCGGINLSQCISYKSENECSEISKLKPSLLYNTGRVISYTVIGGIVGAIGSAVSFSGGAKGIVAVIAGLFMVIMGLNMLNIFPWLKKLTPRMPKAVAKLIHSDGRKHGPLYIGLLNGLMPCGPLQSMQLYALGTGSFTAGALSMFLFSIGTVPLMFGFGAVSSILSGRFTHKMMKFSAVLVMVLGVIMVNRGLGLSGLAMPSLVSDSQAAVSGNIARVEGNIQTVTTELERRGYPTIIVQKGIPLKWVMKAERQNINGCNNSIIIPKYNVTADFAPGDNVIEFTPDSEGNIVYTCWMGMIRGNIKVVADISKVTEDDVKSANNSAASSSGGSDYGDISNVKIPADKIEVAKIKDGIHEIKVDIKGDKLTPAVYVVQKGVPVRWTINVTGLNEYNGDLLVPEYNARIILKEGSNIIERPFDYSFGYYGKDGKVAGYIKVVDDINKVDIRQVKDEIINYSPPAVNTASGGCCCG